MMNKLITSTFLALFAICGVSVGPAGASNITYNIDISDGTNSVIGTITTDGTIGNLISIPTDPFVSWNLQITIGSVSGSDIGPSVPFGDKSLGGALTSDTQFFLDFTRIGNSSLFILDGTNAGFTASNSGNPAFPDANGISLTVGSTTGFIALPDDVSTTIGVAAAAPEPSTWAMMILGFAGIGAMTYRRRKSSAIAA